MDDLYIVPGPDGGWVELAATTAPQAQGRVFRKHILSEGPLLYPKAKGGTVDIDSAFLDRMVTNFEAAYCPIVQTPIVGDDNKHTEDPDKNIGRVIGLTHKDGKLYADIDVRDKADKVGKTLIGVSAAFSTDYRDRKSGAYVGPVIQHVAFTNNPYLSDLEEGFEEIVAASADSSDQNVVLLTSPTSKGNVMLTIDEIVSAAKEHGIDLPALQATAKSAGAAVTLSNRLADALSEGGLITLSAGEAVPDADELIGKVTEIVLSNTALRTENDEIKSAGAKQAAEARVDKLITDGFILPAKRDANIDLLLTHPESFEALVPEKAILALSNVGGDDAEIGSEIALSAGDIDSATQSEIDRIATGAAVTLGLTKAAA